MKKKQLLSGVMALLLSASLCACGGSKTAEGTSEAAGESSEAETSNTLSEGTPVPGGSVVYGMTQDLASLDPHVDTDAGTRDVVFNLYEGLVKPTSDGGFIPAVASDYIISDDAKTYTFTLRDGITFHDGTPVTIEDVKYSIDRYAEIQGESSAFSSLVDSVEVQDDKTLVVNLKESYSEFLPMMTIAIIPQSNEDPAGNPIGTGPFKYVSYTPGQNLELEKYDGYWQEGVPSLDSVEFKFIADVDTAFVELQAGTIDILKYLTSAQAETLGDDYNIVQGSMNLVHAMYLNSAYEPLSKTEVRQALCYAVDRDAINNFIFGGKSHIIGSHMIPAMSKYYEPEAETVYSYDPEKAKELLADAGYADGFDLEITVPSSYSQHVDSAQIIADELSQVGINVTLNQVEWSTWLQDVYKGGNFQATVIGFDGTLAPSDWLKKYVTDDAKNFMHYSNTEYDDVFNTAYTTVDDDVKVENYKKAQMILAEDAAAVYIEDPANLVAVSKKFGGYTFYPTAAEDMSLLYQVEQ
ncbi:MULTISPECIES: ABC transporter substrate-binding protein [Clostridium]|jgi:peptide/nickel transport system substrate-binding protein|uniref:ABC transporter substrate-binding protein n=1 Tax=Clostridium TaxID=1485 RepID=UPI000E4DC243|nr:MULTISPECIES: ABC transporter substrate-binding protein [Clostridium]RHQ29143.1 ABC transporter substrate-binding protein [Clostridium sp. AF27-5AA]